jgi:hypothetical protein
LDFSQSNTSSAVSPTGIFGMFCQSMPERVLQQGVLPRIVRGSAAHQVILPELPQSARTGATLIGAQ